MSTRLPQFAAIFVVATVSYAAAPKATIPDLIVEKHIPEGCFPDAVHYIRQLAVVRPDIKAEVITVNVDDARGKFCHILALLTDTAGNMYVRDEYYGVMPLRYVKSGSPMKRIESEAVETFDRQTKWLRSNGQKEVTEERISGPVKTPEAHLAAVRLLKSYLPDASIFLIDGKGVAVWHTSATTIQWYSPALGTETLERPAPKPGDRVITDSMIARAFADKAGITGRLDPLN